jgi:hypothetical protein
MPMIFLTYIYSHTHTLAYSERRSSSQRKKESEQISRMDAEIEFSIRVPLEEIRRVKNLGSAKLRSLHFGLKKSVRKK